VLIVYSAALALFLGFAVLAWLAAKNPRAKRLAANYFPPLLLCGIGVIAYLYVQELAGAGLRSSKAEGAFYLGAFAGGAWLIGALIYQVVKSASPKPSVGAQVSFWGPDGATKLTGVIVEVRTDEFVVTTQAGQFTLRSEHILSTSRPPSPPA